MRKLLRYLLLRPIRWLVAKFGSAPDKERIYDALTKLKLLIKTSGGKKGMVIPFVPEKDRFIIFSDQHKGAKNGADDFQLAEPNYLAALHHYHQGKFHLVCLGDSEELWENTLTQVKKYNENSFVAEKKFAEQHMFTKVFGNHDLDWEINPLAEKELREIYREPVVALEGVILEGSIGNNPISFFCTHGHQGDDQSDGNLFSKFFVSKIWAPLQAYLRVNPNTPAYNAMLKTEHNRLMYEWSSKEKDLILITGHTHQPVFESLTHFERLQREKDDMLYGDVRPSYFNSGCCCYDDGDITGIEIVDGCIKLVKWELVEGVSKRVELETEFLEKIYHQLNKVT